MFSGLKLDNRQLSTNLKAKFCILLYFQETQAFARYQGKQYDFFRFLSTLYCQVFATTARSEDQILCRCLLFVTKTSEKNSFQKLLLNRIEIQEKRQNKWNSEDSVASHFRVCILHYLSDHFAPHFNQFYIPKSLTDHPTKSDLRWER